MIVAIDFGRRRIGMAILHADGLVLPLATIEQRSRRASLVAVAQHLKERGCDHVVIGLPLNMDGTSGPAARAAEQFAAELALWTGAKVELHDERLSSFEARARIRQLPRGKRRTVGDDAVAACVILETWLQQHPR
jgi:putative Holliday junction resolvase